MEELAAMGRRIWRGASEQLSINGSLGVGQLEFSDTAMPRASPEVVTDIGLRVLGIAVPGAPPDRLVLDRRFSSRIVVAADSLGQRVTLLFAVFVLFVEIPRGIPVEILPVPLFVAGDLGSSPGFANFQNEVELGDGSSNSHHGTDASGLEQRSSALVGTATLDSELGIVLASMVSGRERVAGEIKCWFGRQRRPMERAAGTTNRNVIEAKTAETA